MHINFATKKGLPLDLKALKEFRLNRLMMVVIAGGMLSLMLIYGSVQKLRLELLNHEKDRIERQIIDLRQGAPIERSNMTNFAQKDGVLANYDKRIMWADILRKLTNSVTSGVWLEGIKSAADKKSVVTITGQAVDQSAVAEFVRSLQNIPEFKEVRIESSTMAEKDKKTSVAFILECSLE